MEVERPLYIQLKLAYPILVDQIPVATDLVNLNVVQFVAREINKIVCPL